MNPRKNSQRCAFLLLLAIARSAHGADRREQTPVVEVFYPALLDRALATAFHQAERTAENIFSKIGVHVQWRLAALPIRGCRQEPMRQTILLAFGSNTPPEFHPRALAFSNPYASGGACITVFLDRFNTSNPSYVASLLGHVLAHEMGHVMQRQDRHSENGVLKAYWSLTEIKKMSSEPMHFTDYDAMLILDAIRAESLRIK